MLAKSRCISHQTTHPTSTPGALDSQHPPAFLLSTPPSSALLPFSKTFLLPFLWTRWWSERPNTAFPKSLANGINNATYKDERILFYNFAFSLIKVFMNGEMTKAYNMQTVHQLNKEMLNKQYNIIYNYYFGKEAIKAP